MEPEFAQALGEVEDGLGDIAQGRPGRYAACWSDSDDVTLFGAWGPVEKGHDAVVATFDWVGGRFSDGELRSEHEVVGVSGDLAYTVGFERGIVRIDGREPGPMTIRVTHVHRRTDGVWRLVHRHADFPPPDQRRPKG